MNKPASECPPVAQIFRVRGTPEVSGIDTVKIGHWPSETEHYVIQDRVPFVGLIGRNGQARSRLVRRACRRPILQGGPSEERHMS